MRIIKKPRQEGIDLDYVAAKNAAIVIPCFLKRGNDMELFLIKGKISPAWFLLIFVCCLGMNVTRGTAQEENLDVFQQWVKWNNPGSLLIHDLIGQANEYYDIRD